MKFLKYFFVSLLPFCFIDVVFATSINNDSYSQSNTFQSSGKYDYSTNNLMGDDFSVVSTGSIGTSYSGKAYYLQFNFHHTLQVGKTYDLKISSTTNDFTNQINGNRVVPLCYNSFSTSFNEDECDSINIVSVIRGATSSGQSKDFTIRFTTNSPLYSYWGFKIAGGMYNLTGVSNFKITGIDLKEVDTTGSENIIANAQSNTQNIIDNSNNNTTTIIENNNQNTQQIIDNFQTDCSNLLDPSNLYQNNVGSYTVEENGIVLQANGQWQNVIYAIPVEQGKTYNFSGKFVSNYTNSIIISLSYNGSNPSSLLNDQFFNYGPTSTNLGTWSTSFTSNRTGYVYLGIWVTKGGNSTNNAAYLEMMFSSETSTYCKFGSKSNKFDETNLQYVDVSLENIISR